MRDEANVARRVSSRMGARYVTREPGRSVFRCCISQASEWSLE
jgi:hypothetical protein